MPDLSLGVCWGSVWGGDFASIASVELLLQRISISFGLSFFVLNSSPSSPPAAAVSRSSLSGTRLVPLNVRWQKVGGGSWGGPLP